MNAKMLLVLLSVTSVSIPAASNTTNEVTQKPVIETTTPLEDLIQDESFKNKYAGGNYNSDNKEVELISFAEYAYDIEYRSDFGLYLYLYIPESISNTIVTDDSINNIEFNTSSSKYYGNYSKYPIKFVSQDDNRFYKFKVKTDEKLYGELEKEHRYYNIGSIELKHYDNSIKDYLIGATYIYSGFAKETNNQSESTLTCQKQGLETLHLTVDKGYYRSGSSDKGADFQNDMFYVYFKIPMAYINNYGGASKIHVEYNKIYYSGFVIGGAAQNVGNGNVTVYYTDEKNSSHNIKVNDFKTFDNIFTIDSYTVGTDDIISKTIVEEKYNNGQLVVNKNDYHEEIFQDDTIDLLSYSANHSDFNQGWTKFFHGSDTTWQSIKNIKCFEEITEKASNDGSNHVISKDDVKLFNSVYDSCQEKYKMYILRFSVSDYYTNLINITGIMGASGTLPIAYYYSATAIIGFDIIDITFNKDGVESVIPISMNPVNIFTDLTPPQNSPKDWTWLLILIVVILACALFQPIFMVLKAIISIPIKLLNSIMNLINGKKKRGKH